MASSSSSRQQHLAFSEIEPDTERRKISESCRLFDVFINHRGPDVKETLAAPLYNSLQKLGLRVFLDKEEMEPGEYFPSTIETAIRSASAHIAIFSERYAESAWCLAELVLMLESGAKIFPLFYGVRPSELRYIESGAYADAFTSYEKKGRYLQKLETWQKALQSASSITGFEINSVESFLNSEEFETLALKVKKEVEGPKPLVVAKHPVGLHKLVKKFESQCLHKLVHEFDNKCGLNIKGHDHSKIVGIVGMGGVGKTTLAKELFNRKRSNYLRTCFLFDVRERASRIGLPSLQVELLRDLFNENPKVFESSEEGINYINHRLENLHRLENNHGRKVLSKDFSFLIVVDDIDHVKQLDTLCIMNMANKSHNSLVIVTTRDVGVLTKAGITNRYTLKGLNRDDGRELFCWHSFDQPNPASGYENLVDAFIDVCGGLPLSLQVLGRHVYDRPVSYWELQLCKVHESLDPDIKDILKISFDALSRVEKQIFMDIACFFVDKCKHTAIRVWQGSGWGAPYALEILKDRCLVEERFGLDGLLWEDSEVLEMHDHLRDLGREMSNEFNSPPRLWSPKYCKRLETKGFENILAKTKGRCFHSIYDRSMGSQITFFMGEPEECAGTSSSLLWLQLDLYGKELSSIPAWIPLQNLQCLRISHGCLKRLWQSNVEAPSQLKELQLYQTTLKEFPDFKGISDNLEQVVLDANDMPKESWSLLESLRVYPRSLVLTCSTLHAELACNNREDKTTFKSSYFTGLVIQNFVKQSDELALYNIGEPTVRKCPMSNLKNLEINNQLHVTKILICGNYYPGLLSLKILDMESLIDINLYGVKTLNCLEISTCKSLKRLSETSNFRNLIEFNISQCPELEELSVARLTCLEKLTITNCEQLKIVSGLSHLRKLVKLDIIECSELEELPSLSRMRSLQEIEIDSCGKLDFESLCLTGMKFLKRITLDRNVKVKYFELDSCQNLETIMFGCEELIELRIRSCPMLDELPSFSRMRCLEEIEIGSCGKLDFEFFCLSRMKFLKKVTLDKNVKVKYFELDSCQNLETLMFACEELIELRIRGCPQLKDLPAFTGPVCLESVVIDGCGKLKNITLPSSLINLYVKGCRELRRLAGIGHLKKLTWVNIIKCPELEKLPSLSIMRCLEEIEIDSCGKLYFKLLHLSGLKFLERITLNRNVKVKYFSLDSCQSLKTIMFGCEELIELSIRNCPRFKCLELDGCQNLRSVSGNFDLTKLNINRCPELEELPSLSKMFCLEEIEIYSWEKLQNITLPTTLRSLVIQSCRDLQRVSVAGDFMELVKLIISECPELDELPSLSTVNKMEIFKISCCGKIIKLDILTCLMDLREMNIYECHELQELPSLFTVNMEKFVIYDCEKIQKIILPTTLNKLEIGRCRDLQSVVGTSYLIELRELIINECPELDELPSLSGVNRMEIFQISCCGKIVKLDILSCLTELREMNIWECHELQELPSLSTVNMEEFVIHDCEKIQNIILPTTLNKLWIARCRDLRSVVGTSYFIKLRQVIINECPVLDELRLLCGVNRMEIFQIY